MGKCRPIGRSTMVSDFGGRHIEIALDGHQVWDYSCSCFGLVKEVRLYRHPVYIRMSLKEFEGRFRRLEE